MKDMAESGSNRGSYSNMVSTVPNTIVPLDIEYIDEDATEPQIPKVTSGRSRRRVCRHHSDSETTTTRTRSTIRRSASAVDASRTRLRVRRSTSDRSSSGMVIVGRHLAPPPARSGSSDLGSRSSRCSSPRTLTSHVSMTEIVAFELGLREVPGLTTKEARRRRVVCTVVVVSLAMLVASILLVVLTLLLSPEVDAIIRKGNEDIYRSMSAGASTSSPTTDGAANITSNSTVPSTGPPG